MFYRKKKNSFHFDEMKIVAIEPKKVHKCTKAHMQRCTKALVGQPAIDLPYGEEKDTLKGGEGNRAGEGRCDRKSRYGH
jgi:hypothetical protein